MNPNENPGQPRLRFGRGSSPNVQEVPPRQEEEVVDRPWCKICYEVGNLIPVRVCDCKGTMARIHLNCLRDTILYISQLDENNWPFCPDCKGPYHHIEFRLEMDDLTFMQYVSSQDGWEPAGIMFLVGAAMLVTIILFQFLVKSEKYDYLANVMHYIWVGSLGIVFVVVIGLAVNHFYGLHHRYLNREPTVLQIFLQEGEPEDEVPEGEPRGEAPELQFQGILPFNEELEIPYIDESEGEPDDEDTHL